MGSVPSGPATLEASGTDSGRETFLWSLKFADKLNN